MHAIRKIQEGPLSINVHQFLSLLNLDRAVTHILFLLRRRMSIYGLTQTHQSHAHGNQLHMRLMNSRCFVVLRSTELRYPESSCPLERKLHQTKIPGSTLHSRMERNPSHRRCHCLQIGISLTPELQPVISPSAINLYFLLNAKPSIVTCI